MYIIYIYIGFALGYFQFNLSFTAHSNLIKHILSSPLRWFESIPSGQILNRISTDQRNTDTILLGQCEIFLQKFLLILIIIIIIGISIPYFLIFLLIPLMVYPYWYKIYIQITKESNELGSAAKTPINQLFLQAITGLSSIRVFPNLSAIFEHKMEELTNDLCKCNYLNAVCRRWLSLRLQLLWAMALGLIGVLLVLQKDNLDMGLAAVAMTYALNLTLQFYKLMKSRVEVELGMMAFRRVLKYIIGNPSESPFITNTDPPSGTWPTAGLLNVNDLWLRYTSTDHFVIKGLSFQIAPAQKVK